MKRSLLEYAGRMAVISMVFCLLVASAASGATKHAVDKVPTPRWVQSYDIGRSVEIPRHEIEDGEYYLHVDKQIRVEPGRPTVYYYRYVVLIVNESGMEKASQLSVEFNPDYQKLAFHNLTIHRGDMGISKLDNTPIELLRREKQMEYLLYDGRHTANLIIKDVRKGDILEYAYTITGDNPILNGIFSYRLQTSWGVPVQRQDFILSWPKDRPIHVRQSNNTASIDEKTEGENVVFRVHQEAVQSVNRNTQTPAWYSSYGQIQFSQMDGWQEVVDWAIPIYAGAYEPSPMVEKLAASLRKDKSTINENIVAALNYVQQQIRYLGIEGGINSYKARPATITLEKRFGDCKDKAVVLISLLHAMGIQAHPALVHSSSGRNLKRMLPSIDSFDHVIVRITVGDCWYWVDPTKLYQASSLERVVQPDFEYALVIAPGEKELTTMPPNDHMAQTIIEETFTVAGASDAKAAYSVSSVYRGIDAEAKRRMMAESNTKNIQDGCLDFYRKYYPDIQVRNPVEISDDLENNEIKIVETYTIADFWRGKNTKGATFYGNIVDSYLRLPDQRKRSCPFRLSYPVDVRQTITIHLPETWTVQAYDKKITTPSFDFSGSAVLAPGGHMAVLTYTYRSKADAVPVEHMPDFLDAVDATQQYTTFHIENTSESEDIHSFLSKHAVLLVLAFLGVMLLYVIAEWFVDRRRAGNPVSGHYYPVSLFKFGLLCVATMGFYAVFWSYQQWRYVQQRDASSIKPFWRAFFLPFWYFALYQDMRSDSEKHEGVSSLPPGYWMGILLLIYVGSSLADWSGTRWGWITLFNFLCFIPLVSYTLEKNRSRMDLVRHHSRIRPRHVVLCLMMFPVLLHNLFVSFFWLPGNDVIRGSDLPASNIQFLRKQGLIDKRSELIYFYSDAFWSFKQDGNGVTEKVVFSYWRDEKTGEFNVRKAEYSDISDIEVAYGESFFDTSVILVKLKIHPDFRLYAPAGKGVDYKMVNEIRKRIP